MSTYRRPCTYYSGTQLTLRDHLAADRTVLANDRTLLAYVRTALATFVAGLSLVEFFASVIVRVTGCALVASAVAMLAVGMARHRNTRSRLHAIGRDAIGDGAAD